MTILSAIKRVFSTLLFTFFPKICVQCGKTLSEQESILCSDCNRLSKFSNYSNEEYFAPLMPFAEKIFVYKKYTYVSNIVKYFKFNGFIQIGKKSAMQYAKRLAKESWSKEIDYVVPVPLHKKALRFRGFNQTDILAKSIAKELGAKVSNDNLLRLHHNTPQHYLSKKKRYTNLKDNFSLKDPTLFRNCNVLIVDDVITTCATMEACCIAMKKAENIKIYVSAFSSNRNNF
ncbi:MAG: ComF family protein [Bacteroidales bacterium]|nr:ComF family protein [Bacteroidales bacterium]